VAVLLAGCATAPAAPEIDQARLSALSGDQLQSLDEPKRMVSIAETNVTNAEVSLSEAKRFLDVATQQAEGGAAQATAQPSDESTRRTQVAAQAKRMFASQLVGLRDTELDAARARLGFAQAHLRVAQYRALADRGLAGDLNGPRYRDAERRAHSQVAAADRLMVLRVADLNRARLIWDQRRMETDLAARLYGPPPATGANEGPSQNSTLPESPFAR
jgi:hypothetical protein